MSIIFMVTVLTTVAMEYGLRFQSHSFPANERTSLNLGTEPFGFEKEIALGFEMSFYDSNRFGLICTLTGNNGSSISLVCSSVGDGYQPGIVINEKLNLVPVQFDAPQSSPQHYTIILRRNENKVIFVYNKERFTFPADLSDISSVRINFGRTITQASVAPVEIQDIRIYTEAQNTHKWELRKHEGDSVYDEISGVLAIAQTPHWLIDEHVAWSEIFTFKTDETVQTAFDSEKELFYIVSPERITEYNPVTNSSVHIKVKNDGRAMKVSNYLFYDSITDRLISYSIEPKRVNTFDFSTGKWEKSFDEEFEPKYANHGFTTDGKNGYMFGGYGFYMFHNNLIRLDLATGAMDDITLHPLPDPRTSSALCAVNGKLYLFGGVGNSVGKQEILAKHYADLWEYDLDTMKGRKVWEMDSLIHNFLPSSSMYYVERDTCFYFASTLYGGCMMRISPTHPGYEIVSEPIHSKMDFRDCVFDLYRSANGKNYYLVIDKRLNDFSHDYAIYHIAYPFSDALLYDTSVPGKRHESSPWGWVTCGAAILILAGGGAYYIRRRKSGKTVSPAPSAPAAQVIEKPASTSDNQDAKPYARVETAEPVAVTENYSDDASAAEVTALEDAESKRPKLFDRSKSAISFLGTFDIRDRNGNNITPKFTSRIKDLLIMLIVFSEKDEKGVSYETIDEQIWGDKDEKSAKNNRNVYMRKLRLLLEELGDIEISYDKGYYRINTKDVTIDYHELIRRLGEDDDAESLEGKKLDEVTELLIYGPLLPSASYDWLDEFKSRFTAQSIQILSSLLTRLKDSDDKSLVYRIADTISRHDPLSEEALAVKCRILTAQRMKGVAKNTYDTFCREYEKSYGEEYPVPFSKIFQSETDE